MIKPDKARVFDYTLLVDGNNGEEQFVFSCSFGQGGRCAVQACAMSVDGGGQRIPFLDTLPSDAVYTFLQDALTTWCTRGIKPTPTEALMITERVAAICTRLREFHDLDREGGLLISWRTRS
jgi:hypothetical protein